MSNWRKELKVGDWILVDDMSRQRVVLVRVKEVEPLNSGAAGVFVHSKHNSYSWYPYRLNTSAANILAPLNTKITKILIGEPNA